MALDLFGNPIVARPPRIPQRRPPPSPPPPRRVEPPPRPQEPEKYAVHRASGNRLWFLLGGTVLLFTVQALEVPLKKIPFFDIDLSGLARGTIVGVSGIIVLALGVWYFIDIVAAGLANMGFNRRRKTELYEIGYRRAVATRITGIAVALVVCLGCMGVVVRYDYWQMRPVAVAIYSFFANPPPSPLDKPPVPTKKVEAESDWDKWWRENFGIEPSKP